MTGQFRIYRGLSATTDPERSAASIEEMFIDQEEPAAQILPA
jgi:hypothetical protein